MTEDEELRRAAYGPDRGDGSPASAGSGNDRGTGRGSAADRSGTGGVIAAMATLRRRCPWSGSQDHRSLEKFAREETEELIVALEDFMRDPSPAHREAVVEELGDVFYQVLFHSALLDESAAGEDAVDYGRTLQLIIDRLEDKLVRRHPLAFGPEARQAPASLEEVEREYRRIKAREARQKAGGEEMTARTTERED